jgi:hypothetical protein
MASQPNPPRDPSTTFAVSFAEVATLESIEALGPVAEAALREAGGKLEDARASLIEAVRSGKHVELRVRATVFRQKDGHPNKNFVRFKSSKLADIASSYVGKPFLLNHDKRSQEARMGTIESSELAALPGGWSGFRQTIRVVKPHAVVSVLDGTIDRFSVGWDPSGQVMCTLHKVDVRSRAACWRDGCYPGKATEVDGETKIAEYEWQSTEGTESSAVNAPAVSGTKIDNIAALAEALGLSTPEPEKDPSMKFPLLLAALGVTIRGDITEDRDAELAEAVGDIKTEVKAAQQERDAAVKRATELADGAKEVTTLRARVAELEGAKVDGVLEGAYKSGKLIRGKDDKGKPTPSLREKRLRRIATVDGIEALDAELAEMPVVVPVGRVELDADDPNPRATHGSIPASVLASTAKQLGIKPEDLEAHANQLSGRDGGEN